MDHLKAFKALLVAEGITDPIKLGKQPDEPATVITLIDTGGLQPSDELTVVHQPTIQVLIRAEDYDAARVIAQAVRTAAHGKIAVEYEGVHFMVISLLAEPGSIGQDEKGRDEFSANFACRTREA